MNPKVLYEDQDLMVFDKPAGLLSQGDISGQSHLGTWLQQHWKQHYVGLVHRLDRNTSGLMVAARHSQSAAQLTRLLQEGKLQRRYLALLQGSLREPVVWEHFLKKNSRTHHVTVFRQQAPESQRARMTLSPREILLTKFPDLSVSLASVELETGRSHQIRAQAAFEGYPLVGDRRYGLRRLAPPLLEFPRPALHSYSLEFPHPSQKTLLRFEIPLAPDIEKFYKETLQ